MFQVAHIPGLAGVTVAENLGPLAFATLMDPQGLERSLHLMDRDGTMGPRENLVDVARVADGIARRLSQRRDPKSERAVAPLTDALVRLNTTAIDRDWVAKEELRRLSAGLSEIPRGLYQGAAIDLIRSHPKWITAETLQGGTAISAMELRDQLVQEELKKARFARNYHTVVGAAFLFAGIWGVVAQVTQEVATPWSFAEPWGLFGFVVGVSGLLALGGSYLFDHRGRVVVAKEVMERWNRTLPSLPQIVAELGVG